VCKRERKGDGKRQKIFRKAASKKPKPACSVATDGSRLARSRVGLTIKPMPRAANKKAKMAQTAISDIGKVTVACKRSNTTVSHTNSKDLNSQLSTNMYGLVSEQN